MTTENTRSTESAIPNMDMSALFGAQPETPLEKALSKVEPSDAAAATAAEAKFQFRDLLGDDQIVALRASAPAAAANMVKNPSAIINFGAPVLERLNATASSMLEAQKKIEVPEAEEIVNNLLRSIDGYGEKFKNDKMESALGKITMFFKKNAYSLKAMAREAQPIADKIDMAAVALKSMELKLSDNVDRGRALHDSTLKTLTEVVAVLAALEEISEVVKKDFLEADQILAAAEGAAGDKGLGMVEWKGKKISINELREIHTDLSGGVSELEKSWFDWRQQFFLGYAQAPSVRNLILVSTDMQRRCQVFRTMGLPNAKTSLVMWQQAALAKKAAEVGSALNEGTNKMIQNAYGAAADAVDVVARAAQAPVISEETVFAIINSVKSQCESLVAADKWGRELRSSNLKALEGGEVTINSEFTKSRRQLVENAIQGTSTAAITTNPAPSADILGAIGVAK
jgi:uncharacterized protein YaaN involved in tellurite resistance